MNLIYECIVGLMYYMTVYTEVVQCFLASSSDFLKIMNKQVKRKKKRKRKKEK